MKRIVCYLVAIFSVFYAYAMDIQADPEPGKWCDDIAKAIEYSDTHGIPLLAIWGSSGCSHCRALENLLVGENTDSEFAVWAEQRKLVMCLAIDDDACKQFCRTGAKSLNYYPFVCVYWKKPTGKLLKQNFSGTLDYMPVRDGGLVPSLIASVEKYIGDYEASESSSGKLLLSNISKEGALKLNPYLYAKRTLVVPLFSMEEPQYLDGVLTLVTTEKNKLSAKYTGLSTKSLSLSGSWQLLDDNSYEVKTELKKNGHTLILQLSAGGQLQATFTPNGTLRFTASTGSISLADASSILGKQIVSAVLVPNEDGCESGMGYLTMTLSGKKAAYQGMLPDGTSFSGTQAIFPCEDSLVVPIFKTIGKRSISAGVFCDKILEKYTLSSSTNYQFCVWNATDAACESYDLASCENQAGLGVEAICSKLGISPRLLFHVDMDALSDVGTMIDDISDVELLAQGNRLVIAEKGSSLKSISYNKTKNIFTGNVNVPLKAGSYLRATLKGVIMPRYDVQGNLIVGSGSLYFKDTVNGAKITRSIPVTIKPL